MGLEAEFFLVRKDDNGQLVVDDPLDTSEQPCYDAKALYRNYEFLTTLSRYANELGYGNYANDHEDANGQFESNFNYDDALVTCDRAIFFRYMVHVMAQQRGKLATFMPKPFGHLTGNGCHFHLSLWDKAGKKNLFEDAKDSNGYGLSDTAYHFIAGLIQHADAVSAIVAPTVNSYKRIGVGAPDSGAASSRATSGKQTSRAARQAANEEAPTEVTVFRPKPRRGARRSVSCRQRGSAPVPTATSRSRISRA